MRAPAEERRRASRAPRLRRRRSRYPLPATSAAPRRGRLPCGNLPPHERNPCSEKQQCHRPTPVRQRALRCRWEDCRGCRRGRVPRWGADSLAGPLHGHEELQRRRRPTARRQRFESGPSGKRRMAGKASTSGKNVASAPEQQRPRPTVLAAVFAKVEDEVEPRHVVQGEPRRVIRSADRVRTRVCASREANATRMRRDRTRTSPSSVGHGFARHHAERDVDHQQHQHENIRR